MSNINKFLKITFFSLLIFSFSFFLIQAATGAIDDSNHTSFLCSNIGCTTGSSINWKISSGTGTPVSITDSALIGNLWGENIGWINLAPNNQGVKNTASGTLSGYAWGQNTGWINFRPPHGGVSINILGEFSGYAWAQNYGWIKFACPGTNTCVKTDWRPASVGGGGGTTSPLKDLCPNLSGDQLIVPDSYVLENGECVLAKADSCPNLDGFQGDVPNGYVVENGNCVVPTIDSCPNLPGNQTSVPGGYILENGNCVLPIVVDVCPNIPGMQSEIPNGFLMIGVNCVTPTTDFCLNLPGEQAKVPDGYVLENGKCVLPVDFCPNIPGMQLKVPDGYIMQNGDCVLPTVDFCPNIPGFQAKVPDGYILKNGQCVLLTDKNCAELGNCSGSISQTPTAQIPLSVSVRISTSPNPVINFVDNSILSSIEIVTAPINNYLSKKFSAPTVQKIHTGLKITSVTTAATGVTVSTGALLALNPISIPDIALASLRGWSMFLTALGIRKRKKPWGTVYDSITKQPLDPVYVSLINLEGAEVASSITDVDGRYGFLVEPGAYKVVPKKTNYTFPSRTLSNNLSDELYKDLYFGDYLNVGKEEVIVKNIPMDSLSFDWNEFAKNKDKIFRFYSKRELLVARLSNWLFSLGFTASAFALIVSPERFNLIIFALYIVIFIFRRTNFKQKARGRILDQNGDPLSFALISVYSFETNVEIAHKAADQMGHYHILVPNGNYYVKIQKKNEDGSYSLVQTSESFKVTKGILNKVFNV